MYFEKISFDQWKKDYLKLCQTQDEFMPMSIEQSYNDIKLPKQGTKHSMGVDFFAPYTITIPHGFHHTIPTGIRWVTKPIDSHVGLIIVPRSGLGFKYGLRLANTVGIIDADYCNAKNEGHIMIKMFNPSWEDVTIQCGNGFAQGIILPYIIPDGTESNEQREGGFGSTTK